MDYVEWCDSLADAIADYAEGQHDRWLELHQFASHYIASNRLSDQGAVDDAVILDSAHVLATVGISDNEDLLHLKHSDLARLRNNYSRWTHACSYKLDDASLVLLDTLNRLSQSEQDSFTTVEEIDLDRIIDEVNQDSGGFSIDVNRAEEILLNELELFGLVRSRKTMESTHYTSSYLGVARTGRTYVVQDQEIDVLRTAGEGDTLDLKRICKLNTDAEKLEFVKDVTALANAGGPGPRFLLLGVEDNGEFFVPASADAAAEHRESLKRITDAQLQQIVETRTTHSPSVRIPVRGEHRDGPYLLIEISRDVGHLPYRVYRDQADRAAPNAHELGEVWVRKGSTKALATAAEIAALEHRALLLQRIRTAN